MTGMTAAQRAYDDEDVRGKMFAFADLPTLLALRNTCHELRIGILQDPILAQKLFMSKATDDNAPISINVHVFNGGWLRGFVSTGQHPQLPAMSYNIIRNQYIRHPPNIDYLFEPHLIREHPCFLGMLPADGDLPEMPIVSPNFGRENYVIRDPPIDTLVIDDVGELPGILEQNPSYLDMYPSSIPIQMELEFWQVSQGVGFKLPNDADGVYRNYPRTLYFKLVQLATFREWFELAIRLDRVACAYEGRDGAEPRHWQCKKSWTPETLVEEEISLGLV